MGRPAPAPGPQAQALINRGEAMSSSAPGVVPEAPTEHHLRRAVGLRGLTMISLGSIIGSGWLLGALTAAKVAGAASLVSWIMAGPVRVPPPPPHTAPGSP